MRPAVRLLSGSQIIPLDQDVVSVPAGPTVVSIEGHRSLDVRLDGKRQFFGVIGDDSPYLMAVDLTRSTGFHRIDVGPHTWWFATEDSKLKLAGVQEMLNYLHTSGTGWAGQILFSNGTVLRDPHVIFSWLEQNAGTALKASEEILRAPRVRSIESRKLSRRGGKGVSVSRTLALLRRNPSSYLEEVDEGPLRVQNKEYVPLRVVVGSRTNTFDTVANRRAARLLGEIASLAAEVIAARPDAHVVERCHKWIERAGAARSRPIARQLAAQVSAVTLNAPRQVEEAVDPRYRTSYELNRSVGKFAWSATREILPTYSYVQRSDTIYQAFVANVMAEAFDLRPTSAVLGQKSPAFSGSKFDLYYDARPPQKVLRSWRSYTQQPDSSRPDLVLQNRVTGEVLVLDAKYRLDGEAATESSRKDIVSYMQLYGLNHTVIVYPGSISVGPTAISSHGKSIVEVPVSPAPGLAKSLGPVFRRLLSLMEAPKY